MVELQFLRVILATVDTTTLVAQDDVDLDPLRDVTVVADSDQSGLAAGATLLLRWEILPSLLVLLLEAEHRSVHFLHQST